MPTVLDAFVIELGLDPKNLTKGQQQAIANFKQAQQQMLDTAKKIEEGAARIVNVMHKIRSAAITFTASLVGAYGIKEFFNNMISADAQLGRFARSLGITAEEISVWQHAVQNSGGTVEEAAHSVKMLSDYFQDLTLAPERTAEMGAYLRQLNVYVDDLFKGGVPALGDFEKLMLRISKATEGKKIPQITHFLELMGMPSGVINLLTRGEAAVRKYLAEAQRLGPTFKEDTDAATKFEAAWNKASQSLTRFGHTMVTYVGPKVAEWLDILTEKLEQLNQLHNLPNPAETGMPWSPSDFLTAYKQFSNPIAKSSPPAGAPIKPGAAGGGGITVGTAALVSSLMSDEPLLNQVTALNDFYHKGTKSAHAIGQAIDFTIKDTKRAAEVSERWRQRLARMGIDAVVLDEYNHPSKNSTGGHIHVAFKSDADSKRYAQMTGAGIPAMGGKSSTSTNSSEFNINGDVNVNAPYATNAKEIAGAMGSALKDESSRFMAGCADGGCN